MKQLKIHILIPNCSVDRTHCEICLHHHNMVVWNSVCSTYTLKVADKEFTITPEMVEVKRFTKTIHGNEDTGLYFI